MGRKLGVAWMGSVLGALMLASPAMTWSAEQIMKVDDAAQTVQRMETHWQTLIRESDPARRKALIAEHRQMMAEARAALGAIPGEPIKGSSPGGMMGSHHWQDLQNTAELHSMMLDMMK